MKLGLVATVLVLGGLLAWMVFSMRGQAKVGCELCIEFGGRSACRSAAAANQKDAVLAATTAACAVLAAGVTETVTCQRVPPSKLECK